MSLRITPSATTSNPSHTSAPLSAPSAPGLPDPLRNRQNHPIAPSSKTNTTSAPTESAHPLESRLKNWAATQEALKMESLRRVFGIAEPVRRGMELKIAREGEWRPAVLGGGIGRSGVHEEVLGGRDTEISWEDVFRGDELRDIPDFHTEMEARLGMNW
ncbi:MAG: hypothetical protein M1819_001204 [Sarea resinae]|nr:MAG: hypothetical protein M1819_001204 [Sarea resinae]